jgi:glycosyltransferase 2 family protein
VRYLKYILIGLVVIGILLFLRATDWQAILAALQQIGWHALWLVFFTCLSGIFGAIAWRYCITSGREHVSFIDLFMIRHIGETIGVLNPTGIIAGDGAKVGMLTNKGVSAEVGLTSIVVSRTLTMLSHFAVFILSGLIISPMFGLRITAVFAVIVFIIWLIFKILRPIWRRNKSAWLQKMEDRNYIRILESGRKMRAQMRILFKFDRRSLWIAFFFLMLHWVMGAAEFWVILRLLDSPITLAQAVLIDSGVGFFKAAGIIIPGQLGVEEYGNKYMLETVGVHDQTIWITASILRRARQVFWILFGIVVYFISYHKMQVKSQAE